MIIQDLKKRLIEGEVTSYHWIQTGSMWANVLIKKMDMHEEKKKLLAQGCLRKTNYGINHRREMLGLVLPLSFIREEPLCGYNLKET